MVKKRGMLGLWETEAEVLGSEGVGQLFALRKLKWGTRRIAEALGVSRNTVKAWLRKGPGRIYEGPLRKGALEPHLEWLRGRFEDGVRNGDVLRQELATKGVAVSLRTVERAIRPWNREAKAAEKATVRFETAPGRQLQVDFGEKWLEIGGVAQKRYVFVATLGFSRRTYAQVFGSQRQRDWIAGMEGAFQHFGGVPQEILVDNAKSLVLSRAGGKAQFHPEFAAFCGHWGTRPRACQPYRARTKGKVESGVGYVKKNGLGGLTFADDAALDGHLLRWMAEVADVREHGTTHERPLDRFLRAEAAKLIPLGGQRSYLRTRQLTRRVATDFRIDVDTNRYSVPAQFVGEIVDVWIEADLLRVEWQDRVIAEHTVNPGRHQVVEDPGHVESFVNGEARIGRPCAGSQDIQRPLADYEQAAGGETW